MFHCVKAHPKPKYIPLRSVKLWKLTMYFQSGLHCMLKILLCKKQRKKLHEPRAPKGLGTALIRHVKIRAFVSLCYNCNCKGQRSLFFLHLERAEWGERRKIPQEEGDVFHRQEFQWKTFRVWLPLTTFPSRCATDWAQVCNRVCNQWC